MKGQVPFGGTTYVSAREAMPKMVPDQVGGASLSVEIIIVLRVFLRDI